MSKIQSPIVALQAAFGAGLSGKIPDGAYDEGLRRLSADIDQLRSKCTWEPLVLAYQCSIRLIETASGKTLHGTFDARPDDPELRTRMDARVRKAVLYAIRGQDWFGHTRRFATVWLTTMAIATFCFDGEDGLLAACLTEVTSQGPPVVMLAALGTGTWSDF